MNSIAKANRIAKTTCKVLCLTRDDPDVPTIFGRGYAHSRMWAQYAGNYTGVCLIFDRDQLAADIQQTLAHKGDLWHDRVRYVDEAPDEINAFALDRDKIQKLGLEQTIADHVRDHRQPLFFRKNLDWASECEFRWVLRSPEPVAEFVSIRHSLVGILTGHDFPPDDRDALAYLAAPFNGVAIAQCRWDNGSIQLPGNDPAVTHFRLRFWPAGSPWSDGSPGPPLDEFPENRPS